MVRKSVRGVLAALFVLANLALVAAPAGAGWDVRNCIDEDGEISTCCKVCWFFCDACEGMEGDPDGDPDNDQELD